ncbi:hypothetical protein NUW54_g1509 [Trametes sanguinea]|uniref:Uncharacterized protein n=1 Tax=Trametes sanguinea TaxID=158606 RepID=A0ACC1Q7V4_9APHY|nr:hypothetical protein NUW54_g1509 [Trametes sanguinea]
MPLERCSPQRQDGVWHPVAFLSKAMSSTERNYEIYDKELLAIMTALDEFRHYLMGAAQPFEIWTDHKNLEYYRKPQKLNRRQARWVSELANYQFTLHHKPGKTNVKSDLLSRRADHDRGDNDNTDVIVLKDEWFQRVTEYRLEGEEEDILRRIRRNRGNRDRAVEKVEDLDPQDADVRLLALARLKLHERLAQQRGRAQARLGETQRVAEERLRLEQLVKQRGR